MNAKITALPWYTEEHNNKSDVLVSNDDFQIAVCLAHPIHGEAQANAEFIVRACNAHDDLVKALQATKKRISHLSAVPGFPALIATVDAALAKAGAA